MRTSSASLSLCSLLSGGRVFDHLRDVDVEVVIVALMRGAVVLACFIHGNIRLGGREPGHLTSTVTIGSR
jgi:hypothetical protein